jgi:glutamyl-tRNA reductase
MKMLPNETYQQWSKRVAMFEQGRALQRIAEGEDAEKVIEDMSRRMIDKLLHPVIKAIKDASVSDYDAEESRRKYQENYLNHYGNVADHVDGNFFDNSQ